MLGVGQLPSYQSTTPVMKDISPPAPPPPAAKTEPQEEFDRSTGSSPASSSASPPAPPGLSTGTGNGDVESAVSPQTTSANAAVAPRHGRDSSWLELEACREHLRQTCPRQAEECRYAHPEQGIYVKEGRVTCCYDFLKVVLPLVVHVRARGYP